MIIWINGAFGSGKTHVAKELVDRLPNAFLFDPEEAGFYIRSNMPDVISKGDFQDFSLWRQFNYDMLLYIAEHFEGVVVVPMTVTSESYFHEMIGKMQQVHTLHHVTLLASRAILEKRLNKRGHKDGSWAHEQIDRCLKAFETDTFETYINTDNLTIEQVVEAIAKVVNIELPKDTRSKFKVHWERFLYWTHQRRGLK